MPNVQLSVVQAAAEVNVPSGRVLLALLPLLALILGRPATG